MKNFALLLAAVGIWASSSSSAEAHGYVTYYRPAVRPLVVVQPTPVYQTSYFATAPVVAPAPAVVVAPAPVVYQPVTRVRSRYRPFLGGTVTRVRHGYSRAYYAPAYGY